MIKFQLQLRKLQDEKQLQLLKAIFETQEGERGRLAEDLHDSVGQVLSAIKLNLHRLEKNQGKENEDFESRNAILEKTRQLLDDCLVEIRNIIRNILPPVLTDFGLPEALENLAVKVQQNTGIEVKFYPVKNLYRYEKETEVMMYRIVQELFNNAIKHSHASKIELNLARQNGNLVLTYVDNGLGFDRSKVKEGLGLKNIESRIQLMKGSFEMDLDRKSGTAIKLKVPIEELKNQNK